LEEEQEQEQEEQEMLRRISLNVIRTLKTRRKSGSIAKVPLTVHGHIRHMYILPIWLCGGGDGRNS